MTVPNEWEVDLERVLCWLLNEAIRRTGSTSRLATEALDNNDRTVGTDSSLYYLDTTYEVTSAD